jgi:hypothetical protein
VHRLAWQTPWQEDDATVLQVAERLAAKRGVGQFDVDFRGLFER